MHPQPGELPGGGVGLLGQTYAAYEVIVVDNVSSDETKAVVDSRLPHPQLTYVYQGKLGLSTARNRGAAIAQGSILAYLDDDAEAAPHWLAALAAAVEAHPQAAIAGGPVSLIWPPACTPPRWLSPGLAENLGAYDLGATLERITNPGQTPRGLNYAVKQSFWRRWVGLIRTWAGWVKTCCRTKNCTATSGC